MLKYSSPISWAGGKFFIRHLLIPLLPDTGYDRWVEPFCGGASMYFGQPVRKAWLNDISCSLINAYRHIRDKPDELVAEYQKLPPTKDEFTRICKDPSINPLKSAAEFLFQNRFTYIASTPVLGFKKSPVSFTDRHPKDARRKAQKKLPQRIIFASKILQQARLSCGDFMDIIAECDATDFIYCDPPYFGLEHYYRGGFAEHHERLLDALADADSRGIRYMLSYNDHPSIREMYSQYKITEIDCLYKHAYIKNRREKHTRQKTELVITNYEPPHQLTLDI